MKKIVGAVIVGIVATVAYCVSPEPKMLAVDLGNGTLTFKVPEQRIVQVQLNAKPESFGLDATAKVDTNVIVATQNIVVEFTAVRSDGQKIVKPIVMGKFLDPGTGKTFDMKKMSGSIAMDWQIVKCLSNGKNCNRETWFYVNDNQAFEITIAVLDLKDKKAQALKKQILESVVFSPRPGMDEVLLPALP